MRQLRCRPHRRYGDQLRCNNDTPLLHDSAMVLLPRHSRQFAPALILPVVLLLEIVTAVAAWISIVLCYSSCCFVGTVDGFRPTIRIILPSNQQKQINSATIIQYATKGFGGDGGSVSRKISNTKTTTVKKNNRLMDALDDKPKKRSKVVTTSSDTNNGNITKPYVKAEQDQLLDALAYKSSRTAIGRVVAEFVAPTSTTSTGIIHQINDPFWELIPSLISSKFPTVNDDQLHRVAGFIRHTLTNQVMAATTNGMDHQGQRPIDWIDTDDGNNNNKNSTNRYRPYEDLHAYMPGLGPTRPFYDPTTMALCQRLQGKYNIIRQEYETLMQSPDIQNQFQSVTDMNYDSGWQTLILFYNGQRIPQFPYHLCPVTTTLMESVPLAGRIAGFNRQQPRSGIPSHTDGNNMWLTCQMGISVPDPIETNNDIDDSTTAANRNTGDPQHQRAYIRVGNETRYWENGQCLVYDTTYTHETYNPHPLQERVVLHIDFFNTIAMTDIEIKIMQYIYQLREQFMKAEGNAKVGARIL